MRWESDTGGGLTLKCSYFAVKHTGQKRGRRSNLPVNEGIKSNHAIFDGIRSGMVDGLNQLLLVFNSARTSCLGRATEHRIPRSVASSRRHKSLSL